MEPPTVCLVKGLLAILFSVALVVSQAPASLNGPLVPGKHQAAARKCCGECGPCKGSSCCVAKNDSDSQPPLSAVPTPNASQIDLQALTFASLLAWEQTPAESVIAPVSVLVPPSVAAPLYQRNCSYLI
jgi:hypothetical protein